MDDSRWQQIQELFRQALERPSEQRSEFLSRTCGDDAELRAEVESLLEHRSLAGDDFLQPLQQTETIAASEETSVLSPPMQIEGYDFVRELGRGGQAVVYEAIQKATKRKVAVKILLEGPYAAKAAQKRFEREIEIIANLQHPNVVEVFEAGVTPTGQHYFVMEYIRGLPLQRFVRDRKPSLDEVLQIFLTICDGVQYAHQRGVIHRDLKPSNILVNAEGVPTILDFGLAKQLVSGADSVSLTEHLLGTLPYMSPEQTRNNPEEVDTRADVYALGVILYELLTGHYPYPVVGELMEVLRNIAETPPELPSRKWSRESGIRQRLGRRSRKDRCPIDHDVQTITLKALAKERERRYQSAGELARDIEHYLNGEPIEAKRDSAWYVLRKLARRHSYATAAVLSLVVIVVSSVVISADFYRQAEHARHEKTKSDLSALRKDYQMAEYAREELASQVRQMALGWFLLEWQADRLERCRQIAAQVAPDSAEQVAMEFLLDEGVSFDELLTRLPGERLALAFLVKGERLAKAGRTEEATAAFSACTEARGSSWIQAAARARLEALGGSAPHAARAPADVP